MGRKKKQIGYEISKDFSPVTMYIAARIHAIRESKGLSQTDLANQIGLERISIVGAESGRSTNITRLFEITEALGVDIMDIFPTMEWFKMSKNKRAVKKITIELI